MKLRGGGRIIVGIETFNETLIYQFWEHWIKILFERIFSYPAEEGKLFVCIQYLTIRAFLNFKEAKI